MDEHADWHRNASSQAYLSCTLLIRLHRMRKSDEYLDDRGCGLLTRYPIADPHVHNR